MLCGAIFGKFWGGTFDIVSPTLLKSCVILIAPRINAHGETQGWSYTVQYLGFMITVVKKMGGGTFDIVAPLPLSHPHPHLFDAHHH